MIHLKKLAVGVEDLDALGAFQARRLAEMRAQGHDYLWTYTRNTPKRKDEILEGGSIYWVIKGQFRARQEILGFENDIDGEGRKYCLFILDPELIPVENVAHKAFQGWRYLELKDAPKDRDPSNVSGDKLPDELSDELRELGLL